MEAPPSGGVRWDVENDSYRGWLPPEQILSHHFEKKNRHAVHLKLREYVKIHISLLYKPNIRWNSNIVITFLVKIFNFSHIFTWNWLFWARWWIWRHCDVILGILGTYFGMFGKARPIVILWYQLDVSAGLHFQVHRGVVTTPSRVRRVTKKKKKKKGPREKNNLFYGRRDSKKRSVGRHIF